MVQLPQEFYLPLDAEPAGVFFFGKSPEIRIRDIERGVARMGGHRTPDYCQSYLLAANTLLTAAREQKTLDHHGLPIFFLQRHAAELMLKEPLQLGIEIQDYKDKLKRPLAEFASNGLRKRAKESHVLDQLLADLKMMVNEVGYVKVPEPLCTAVREITKVEQSAHTWSRYSFRLELKKNTVHRHLQNETVIPLAKIQNLLQEARKVLGVNWAMDSTLMGTLGGELEMLWRMAGEID